MKRKGKFTAIISYKLISELEINGLGLANAIKLQFLFFKHRPNSLKSPKFNTSNTKSHNGCNNTSNRAKDGVDIPISFVG